MELVSPNTSSQKISQYLISKINKPYKSLSIKEKIDVSAEIILNRQYIISQEVFLQEEVQATLLNWIWKIRKNIDEFIVPKSTDTIYEFLKPFEKKAGSVNIYWRLYGTSGFVTQLFT